MQHRIDVGAGHTIGEDGKIIKGRWKGLKTNSSEGKRRAGRRKQATIAAANDSLPEEADDDEELPEVFDDDDHESAPNLMDDKESAADADEDGAARDQEDEYMNGVEHNGIVDNETQASRRAERASRRAMMSGRDFTVERYGTGNMLTHSRSSCR